MKDTREAAKTINDWLYTDSRFRIAPGMLEAALARDLELQLQLHGSSALPTEEECQLLVCGDDEGSIPEELGLGRFPFTNELIAAHF